MEPVRLTQLIARASRSLNRSGDAALKPLGLRYAQVPVIMLLRRDGTLTQKLLAQQAGMEQPSMAELLSRMNRDGLIRQTPNPRDGRSHAITLAEGNDDRLSEAHNRMADLEERALRGLTPEQVTTLRALLGQVVSNLEDNALRTSS